MSARGNRPSHAFGSVRVPVLSAAWRYRRFILNMVRREFRSRYLRSLLGVFWSVLTPLATILVYLVVFSAVMRGRLPGGRGDSLTYGLFLCTGILIWGFFAEVVTRCQTVFVEHANLLKKLDFPRMTLPIIVLANAFVNFAFVAVVFVLLLFAVDRFPGLVLLACVPLLVVQQAFAVGIGVLFGTLHVFFRDIGEMVTVLMNLWFWGTPIVYHVGIMPERVREILELNPLTHLFIAYQEIVVDGRWPDWPGLWYPAVVAAVAVVLGVVVFRKLSGEMVDEL